jgi:hypothetical protein
VQIIERQKSTFFSALPHAHQPDCSSFSAAFSSAVLPRYTLFANGSAAFHPATDVFNLNPIQSSC